MDYSTSTLDGGQMGSWLSDLTGINIESGGIFSKSAEDLKERVVGAALSDPTLQATAQRAAERGLVEKASDAIAQQYYQAKKNPMPYILAAVAIAAIIFFMKKKNSLKVFSPA